MKDKKLPTDLPMKTLKELWPWPTLIIYLSYINGWLDIEHEFAICASRLAKPMWTRNYIVKRRMQKLNQEKYLDLSYTDKGKIILRFTKQTKDLFDNDIKTRG